MAIISSRLGEKDKAEEYYKKSIEVNPTHITYHNYALFLQINGSLIEAEEQYAQALKLEPNFIQGKCNYAVLLTKMGKS